MASLPPGTSWVEPKYAQELFDYMLSLHSKNVELLPNKDILRAQQTGDLSKQISEHNIVEWKKSIDVAQITLQKYWKEENAIVIYTVFSFKIQGNSGRFYPFNVAITGNIVLQK